MNIDINPFYLRASENIELDNRFLELFSPEVLEIFSEEETTFWKKVLIIRSSPGGGKTTLLKLFTPEILLRLKEMNGDDHKKEIFNYLRFIDVYGDDKEIKVIGSLISFNNEYVTIEFLQLSERRKNQIFLALINIRIIISFFQSLYTLKRFKNNDDLRKIKFKNLYSALFPSGLKNLSDGLELYEWACDQEEIICKEIGDINVEGMDNINGIDSLYSLDMLAPQNILFNDEVLDDRVLIMFDDVHNLSSFQRDYFVSSILKKRPAVNIWIAERLKALTMNELYSEGNTEKRDMLTINIEKFWSKKHSAFPKFARSVSNRRLAMIYESRDIASFLLEEYDVEESHKIKESLNIVKNRVLDLYGNNKRYRDWIAVKEVEGGSPYEQLINWRMLEILIYRDINKAQQRFKFIDDEDILDEYELDKQGQSDVREAAQLFINREFKISYYYGIKRLCKLASYNIEQYLSIAGKLFEEIRTNAIKKIVKPEITIEISPKRQEQIIKNVISKEKWNELQAKVPNFHKLKKFLESIGDFCRYETYLENAWNPPGLNAIAVSMQDREILKRSINHNSVYPYYDLAKCISDCIAYNLLDFELNYRCKNNDWMILYLNKMFCVKFNLPMNKGGFKEQSLNTLALWLNRGYISPNKNRFDI